MSKYTESGVNIDEGNRFVNLIKKSVESTRIPGVIGGLGGFAGLFDLSAVMVDEPVLVSCTDGVGTKLRVAIEAQKFDTVGIDLVAMSVNDLIVTGARPLLFLDYIATGKLSPEAMVSVVEGISEGCRQSGAALLGGETAEMPGMYAPGDFDLAGFAVGIVSRPKMIDGSKIREGDVIVGLASSGFHSNGYSLLRKVFFEEKGLSPFDLLPGYGTVGDLLLTPTTIYVKTILAALERIDIHGMVHITGGGFYDNIPRVLPEGLCAVVDKNAFTEPPAVRALRSIADIEERELYRVFNMGIGYITVLPEKYAQDMIAVASAMGISATVIGNVIKSDKEVLIKGIDI